MGNKKNYFTCMRKMITMFLFAMVHNTFAQHPIRVVIAGLNHDHVHGILNQYNNGLVDIVGIAEPSKALQQKFGKLYHLPDSLFYDDLKKVVSEKKPDAVLGYNAAAKHLDIVRVCAPLGISVMVEKPLAANLSQARQIETWLISFTLKY